MYTKIDLIFLYKSQLFLIHKIDLNFSKKEDTFIREIYLSQCQSSVYHVYSTYHSHHPKRVFWSLKSRRLDSVWVEWVLNTFSFCNIALELRIFGKVEQYFVFLFNFWQIVTRTKSFVFFCIYCNQDSKPCKV